ncbi:hypothetical protein DFH09DRAFT_1093516 [Mycena vulgaris]|nr:hypothetical protein DFH09DRAFT_1093516 [Mycena vulgaris]
MTRGKILSTPNSQMDQFRSVNPTSYQPSSTNGRRPYLISLCCQDPGGRWRFDSSRRGWKMRSTFFSHRFTNIQREIAPGYRADQRLVYMCEYLTSLPLLNVFRRTSNYGLKFFLAERGDSELNIGPVHTLTIWLVNSQCNKEVESKGCGLALMPALRVVLRGFRVAPPFVSPHFPLCSRFHLHCVSAAPPPAVPIGPAYPSLLCAGMPRAGSPPPNPQREDTKGCMVSVRVRAPFDIVNAQPPLDLPSSDEAEPACPVLTMTPARLQGSNINLNLARGHPAPQPRLLPCVLPAAPAMRVLRGSRASVCICVGSWQVACICERVVCREREWLVRRRGATVKPPVLAPPVNGRDTTPTRHDSDATRLRRDTGPRPSHPRAAPRPSMLCEALRYWIWSAEPDGMCAVRVCATRRGELSRGWRDGGIIGPAVQHRSFKQLSIAEGLKQNRRGHGTLRIGVDSSIWMSQCTAVFQSPGLHLQAGENPELCALFYKICELSKYCVTAIFVFDGPGRPDIKRGKQVIDRPHWLTEHFQAMISAFGFYHYTASCHPISRIYVLVFGATHMISSPSKDDYKELQIFTAAAIKISVHLTLGGLLLMAILIGGDYDDGLDGCAEKTAHALAKLGLGDTLLQATQTMAPADLDVFLGHWRQTLRTELFEGKSRPKHPAIAAAVSDVFPDPKVLHLYVHPLTSWSQDGLGVDSSSWLPRLPNVSAIAKLCELLFSWGTPAELPSKMCDRVLPGLCIRRLAQPRNELHALQKHFAGGYNAEEQRSLSTFLSITMFTNEHYRVKVSTRLFQTTMRSALRGVRPNRSGKKYTSPVTKVVVPIPPSILLHSLPAMVSLYKKRTHKKNITYRAEKIFPSIFVPLTESVRGFISGRSATRVIRPDGPSKQATAGSSKSGCETGVKRAPRTTPKKTGRKKAPTAKLDDLEKTKAKARSDFSQALKTKEAYDGYLVRGKGFLVDVVAQRREKLKTEPSWVCPQGIDTDILEKAFDHPNKHSVFALGLFLTQKFIVEGLGKSTCGGIHGAFAKHWDTMSWTTTGYIRSMWLGSAHFRTSDSSSSGRDRFETIKGVIDGVIGLKVSVALPLEGVVADGRDGIGGLQAFLLPSPMMWSRST